MLLKNVVIGQTLEAALFAYYNQYHYVASSFSQPYFFERNEKFSLFQTIMTREIYDSVKDLLGLLALNIDYPTLKHIRVSNEQISIFDDNLLARYDFEKCYVCDTERVLHEAPIVTTAPETFRVIDDFKLFRMGKTSKHIPPVWSKVALVSEAYFYNSMRIDGAHYITDAVTVSNLNKEQLHSFDYSDTMAMFKLKKLLNDLGFEGLKEKHQYKNGTNRIKKLKIEHVKRFISPVDNNTYKDLDNIKFPKVKLEDFVNGYSTEK